MKTNTVCLFLFGSLLSISGMAQPGKDSTQVKRSYTIDEVVVTGTRNETDIRHLPMTISVVGRQQIEKRYEPSLLPLLTEQVPGFFTTSRGIMGYGVSTGAAGGMSLRGIGGSPTAGLLVLIDGHPQYMGLMGHPIADAISVYVDRESGSLARPCLCTLWLECNGRSNQYSHPQTAG